MAGGFKTVVGPFPMRFGGLEAEAIDVEPADFYSPRVAPTPHYRSNDEESQPEGKVYQSPEFSKVYHE